MVSHNTNARDGQTDKKAERKGQTFKLTA